MLNEEQMRAHFLYRWKLYCRELGLTPAHPLYSALLSAYALGLATALHGDVTMPVLAQVYAHMHEQRQRPSPGVN